MRSVTPFLFICLIVSCRQTPKAPKTFDYGKIENGTYSNTYFDFTMPIPETWEVQNEEQLKASRERGEQYIASKNERLASQLKDIDYAALLSVFKYRKDTITGTFNPSFMFVTENISRAPGINSPIKYFEQSQRMMRQSGVGYNIKPGFDRMNLGGKEFVRMQTTLTVNGIEVNQAYYCTLIKDFALVLIISYVDEEQHEELREAVNKVRFN
jgi:hypothetical protein